MDHIGIDVHKRGSQICILADASRDSEWVAPPERRLRECR